MRYCLRFLASFVIKICQTESVKSPSVWHLHAFTFTSYILEGAYHFKLFFSQAMKSDIHFLEWQFVVLYCVFSNMIKIVLCDFSLESSRTCIRSTLESIKNLMNTDVLLW